MSVRLGPERNLLITFNDTMSLENNDRLCRTCAKVSFRTLIGGSENQTHRELEFDEFWDLPKVLEERKLLVLSTPWLVLSNGRGFRSGRCWEV
jgi:hypothetical protein